MGPVLLHAPRNEIPRIDRVWMYLSVDDGGEGICGACYPDVGWAPLIAADERRLADLTKRAEEIAALTGTEIVLVEFTGWCELRRIHGKSS